MDRVKIYSKYDLTTNMNINNIINFTNKNLINIIYHQVWW